MSNLPPVDPRDPAHIAAQNAGLAADLDADYQALTSQLQRRGIDIERITRAVSGFAVALPSWGVGTGGTRFARFPGPGEPRNVFEKLDDCAVIHKLTAATPTVSLHLPWDRADDFGALKAHAARLGLGFDAVNSNTSLAVSRTPMPRSAPRPSNTISTAFVSGSCWDRRR
jgi:L-rhamnose isomerase/sugar isomerase